MGSKVSSFLRTVASEKRGFKFGEPERIQEDGLAAVVPIIRKTSLRRQYTTFPEVHELKVTDTGHIDRFHFKNPTDKDVFIRAGTIFKGATQERCLTRSAVVFHGQEVDLEVRCIHMSKGINRGAGTTYGGVVPLEVDNASYGDGYRPKDQHTFWSNVQNYSVMCSVGVSTPSADSLRARLERARQPSILSMADLDNSPQNYSLDSIPLRGVAVGNSSPLGTDDLHTAVNQFATDIDAVLKRVKHVPHQVGLGIITDQGCQTIELFDVPESWSAMHTDAVKRVGQDLSRKGENVFDYKPQFALSTMAAVLADEYVENLILDRRPTNGEPPLRIFGLTSERFVGEVVEINDHVMHVVLNRKK